jgi:hypothetical protein
MRLLLFASLAAGEMWEVRDASELHVAMDTGRVNIIEMAGGVYRLADEPGLGDESIFLRIGRNLTIRAAAGAKPVLDGGKQKGVLAVGPGVKAWLQGLEITNGAVQLIGGDNCGGILNRGTLHINDSSIHNNTAGAGGGVYNDNGVLYANNCSVYDNSAYGDGGGIVNHGTGTLTITDSEVHHNRAHNQGGGGIQNDLYATLAIINCSFHHNDADSGGGGIHNNGRLTIADSSVFHNAALAGGGPSRHGLGGGIFNDALDGSTLRATNTTACLNTPDDCYGCKTPLPPCPPPPPLPLVAG